MTNMRTTGKRGAAEDLFDSLTSAEVVERVQAVAAKNDAKSNKRRFNPKDGTAHVVQKGSKRTSWLETPSRDFKAALAFADALILRRGGEVPLGWTRAQVADAHQRALARRTAVLAETA